MNPASGRFVQQSRDQITLFTDPAHPVEHLPLSDFARRVRAGKIHMTREILPDFVLSLPADLRDRKTVYSTIWQMEREARCVGIARLEQALMLRLDMLGASETPEVFAELANAIVGSPANANWDWRAPGLPWRLQMNDIPRRHVGGAVLSAQSPDDLPCVLLQGEPDDAVLKTINYFSNAEPFHLVILGDVEPVAPLAQAARTIAYLPTDDPAACAGFLAGMARILIVLPLVETELFWL